MQDVFFGLPDIFKIEGLNSMNILNVLHVFFLTRDLLYMNDIFRWFIDKTHINGDLVIENMFRALHRYKTSERSAIYRADFFKENSIVDSQYLVDL